MLYHNNVAIRKMIPASALHSRAKRAREPVRQVEPTPTDVLKSILLESGSKLISSADAVSVNRGGITFMKPSEADIAAYDLESVRAIRASDVDRLRELWVEGKSMNACNQFGESLLHMACRRGDLALVKFLVIEAKVRTDRCDDFGRNPFHDALWTSRPNFDVVDVLIEAADPRLLLATDVRGNSPFAYARVEHNAKWVSFLEQRSAKLSRNRDAAIASSSSSTEAPPSSSSPVITSTLESTTPPGPPAATPTPCKNEETSHTGPQSSQ